MADPACDRGDHPARWSICNLEGAAVQPIVRAFTCGRHLHRVLDDMPWEMDAVQVYDLKAGVSRA